MTQVSDAVNPGLSSAPPLPIHMSVSELHSALLTAPLPNRLNTVRGAGRSLTDTFHLSPPTLTYAHSQDSTLHTLWNPPWAAARMAAPLSPRSAPEVARVHRGMS
uniref:Uncharacterized protein n=1 Tax=Knipowitschia caucasica TaxID=637954 RepID=A0AAV2IY11_KNICA